MARYKRYFPLSHEINRDPEVWEITDQFGDRSLRFILEIFSLIDRHENRLPITDQLMASLSRMLRQSLAKCWRILDQMLAKHWLIADEVLANGRPAIVSARNYAEYHRTRSVISAISETKSEQIGHPPILPPLPTSPNDEKEKNHKNDSKRKDDDPGGSVPSLNGKGQKVWVEKPEEVSDQTWQDFVRQRNARKAPFTATALKLMIAEVNKAGITLEDAMSVCCARGWQGFRAEYIKQDDYYNPDLSEAHYDPS